MKSPLANAPARISVTNTSPPSRVRAPARERERTKWSAKLRTSPACLQALAAPDSVLIASTNEGSKGLADTSRPLTRAREGASKDKLRLEC
jgi:hypothetical protein